MAMGIFPWIGIAIAACFIGVYFKRRRVLILAAGIVWALFAIYIRFVAPEACERLCANRLDFLFILPALLLASVAGILDAVRKRRRFRSDARIYF